MIRDTNVQQAFALAILVLAGSVSYRIVKEPPFQREPQTSHEPAMSCPEPTFSSQPVPDSSRPDAGPPVSLSARVASSYPRGRRWPSLADYEDVWFARLGIGEDGSGLTTGTLSEDHYGLLQTLRNLRAARSRIDRREWTLLETMQLAAPRITGLKPASPRQTWVGGLPETGDGPPETWVDCRTGQKPCDGDWRLYGSGWVKFRDAAHEALVMTNLVPEPCPGEPIAYGCYGQPPQCDDDPQALKRGLCLLDCGVVLHFWAKPGRGCELNDPLTTAARERVAGLTKVLSADIVRAP